MKHKGQRICVMGGAPSLEDDLKKVTADVWISVNEHGAKHREVDYVVAMDNIHTKLHTPMQKHLRQFTDAPIIGPWHWNDYQVTRWPLNPRMMLSGVVATWAAYVMGAHPVIIAGYDCYDRTNGMGQHRDYIPHVKSEVRVVSGPLIDFYPEYRQNERRKAYVEPDVMKMMPELDGEIRVKVVKPVDVRGFEWPVGTELIIPRHEVRLQLKHKSLIEV